MFRTINNVEEHIKSSLISETLTTNSAFRNLKINTESIEIKRQLDPEIIKNSLILNDQVNFSYFDSKLQYKLIILRNI